MLLQEIWQHLRQFLSLLKKILKIILLNLNKCKDFEQIASYVGKLTIKHSSPDGVNTDSLVLGATFIIGGQIRGQDLEFT